VELPRRPAERQTLRAGRIRAELQEDGAYSVFVGTQCVDIGLPLDEAKRRVDDLTNIGYSWHSHERAGSRAAERRRRQMMRDAQKDVEWPSTTSKSK
jgi:hypothetical protein